NFSMDRSNLCLVRNVTIRKLSEAEVSSIHGGPIGLESTMTSRPNMPQEFAIEGQFEAQKASGEMLPGQPPGFIELRDVFAQVVRGLRTFKDGRVGFEAIHLRARTFCPYSFPSLGSADLFVPLGNYHLARTELRSAARHIAYMFQRLHPALETACSRLG